jgi:hypothetical protein
MTKRQRKDFDAFVIKGNEMMDLIHKSCMNKTQKEIVSMMLMCLESVSSHYIQN